MLDNRWLTSEVVEVKVQRSALLKCAVFIVILVPFLIYFAYLNSKYPRKEVVLKLDNWLDKKLHWVFFITVTRLYNSKGEFVGCL